MYPRQPRFEGRRLFRSETVQHAKAIVPVHAIGTRVPRPGSGCGRLQRQPEALFALSQRRFRAGALGRLPGAFGDVADQLDFHCGPEPRCRMVGPEGGHQTSALQQLHAHERCDLSRLQGDPLTVREPRIGANVVYHNRLAALIRIPERRSERIRRPRSDKWRDTAHMLAANRVSPIVDFHVADTVHVQMLAKQSRSGFLHVEWIADRPERIGEPEEEGISLLTRTPHLLTACGVDERSNEAVDVSLRVEFGRRLAKDPPDAAIGQSGSGIRPATPSWRATPTGSGAKPPRGRRRGPTVPSRTGWLLRQRARSGQ